MMPPPGSSLQTRKRGGGGAPPPWKPPSSHPSGCLWGPFPPPLWSLATSSLSCVISSLHGLGQVPSLLEPLFSHLCFGTIGPGSPQEPSWPGCSPFGRQVLLPPTPAPGVPASLFLPQLCPPRGMPFPVTSMLLFLQEPAGRCQKYLPDSPQVCPGWLSVV